MSCIKNVKKHQDISVTEEVSDYLQKSSVSDVNISILDYWKLMKNLKSAMTQFAKNILAISAADVEVKCLFNMTWDIITYCWNWLNSDIIENIMLIKYHNMFILSAEVIKIIKERSALTMIVDSDEKESLADELNSTATKLCTELLSDYYFSDNDLYDDSDYENNINFRLCNHNQDKNVDSRLDNDDYD